MIAATPAILCLFAAIRFDQLQLPHILFGKSNPSRQELLRFSLLVAGSSTMISLSSVASAVEEATTKSVCWGIIGLGDVCSKKSGPAFYKCKGSELVAVMRRTPGAAKAWARINVPGGNCVGYDNLDEFLKHPKLDAVYIATPPGSHLHLVRKVADAGIPTCYVEKPVGRCAWETEEMKRLFDKDGSNLFTAYISRAYERTQTVKRLLQEGAVGERVTSIEYTLRGTGGARGMGDELPWRLNATVSGGGLIMDVGCHLIDRLDFLFGPLIHVHGTASKKSKFQDVEDFVSFNAKIAPCSWACISSSEADVRCTWDFAPENQDEECDSLVITGPRGSLQMAAMSPSLPITVLDSEGNVAQQIEFDAPEHTAQLLIQTIVDETLGINDVKCPSRSENALRTSKILDSILQSYYGGRDDQFWTRPQTWPGNVNQ